MTKSKKLALVFDFIAEYLIEHEEKIEKQLLVETKEATKEDTKEGIKENLKINRSLEIMKRINEIDAAKASALNLISGHEKNKQYLNQQLQEMRNEHSLMIVKDIIKEEDILSPILTESLEAIKTHIESFNKNDILKD